MTRKYPQLTRGYIYKFKKFADHRFSSSEVMFFLIVKDLKTQLKYNSLY